MAFTVAEWQGMQLIVTGRDGTPRLWLDAEGELCDAGGHRLTLTDPDDRGDECELASFVAAWLEGAAERDGPTSYHHIHPDLRALVHSMVRVAIVDG
jgi:hypothetical protein